MGILSLRLLGTPEIYLDGHLLRFPTRKAEALLIYLAVEGGLHNRTVLTTLLFPESPPKLARAAFRNTLARLRRVLQNQTQLLVEGDFLSLTDDPLIEIDTQHIEELALTVRAGSTIEVEQLTALIHLARGDFLDGFTLEDAPRFDDWALVKREYYFQLLDQIFDNISELLINKQREALAIALEITLRWLTHNPMSESAYRRLIELRLIAGDRVSALNAYQSCCAMLETELGALPSTQTQALVADIQGEPETALWIDTAVSYIHDDALFINPTGRYSGKVAIRPFLLQSAIQGMYFDLWGFHNIGRCVSYSYRVLMKDSLLDSSNDGLTIVQEGKIIFDGTLRSAPAAMIEAAKSHAPEANQLEVTKAYYKALNEGATK